MGLPGQENQSLKFHIYDLQLTSLKNNDLRSLMVSTVNISILLIEDIDCSIESQNQQAPGDYDDASQVSQTQNLNLLSSIPATWKFNSPASFYAEALDKMTP
ncbi:hypothetical protein Droror1_Dr00003518 [Drosera rotundifolia]